MGDRGYQVGSDRRERVEGRGSRLNEARLSDVHSARPTLSNLQATVSDFWHPFQQPRGSDMSSHSRIPVSQPPDFLLARLCQHRPIGILYRPCSIESDIYQIRLSHDVVGMSDRFSLESSLT